MAERRMFAKSVINSARFLTMPPSSRLLYNKIVPDPTKSKGMDELELFFAERIPRHSDYYKKQQGLVATYNFVYEIIKMFTKSD